MSSRSPCLPSPRDNLLPISFPRVDDEGARGRAGRRGGGGPRPRPAPTILPPEAAAGYFLDGRYEAAAGAFEQARALKPDVAGGNYYLALARVGQGRVEEARTLLARLPAADPFADAGRRLRQKLEAPR
jgi:tetratricopeptide (TPR) repeat protein